MKEGEDGRPLCVAHRAQTSRAQGPPPASSGSTLVGEDADASFCRSLLWKLMRELVVTKELPLGESSRPTLAAYLRIRERRVCEWLQPGGRQSTRHVGRSHSTAKRRKRRCDARSEVGRQVWDLEWQLLGVPAVATSLLQDGSAGLRLRRASNAFDAALRSGAISSGVTAAACWKDGRARQLD